MYRASFIVFITYYKTQLFITKISLYIIHTATCLDISMPLSNSFTFVFGKLHKLLKVKLLILQFHEIIILYLDTISLIIKL